MSKSCHAGRQSWYPSIPSQSRNVENLHEFLHVGDSARQQEWTRPFQRVLRKMDVCTGPERFHHGAESVQVLQVKELGGLTEQSNLNHIHDQEKFGNRRESHNSSHPCSSGGFSPGHTTAQLFQEVQKIMGDEIKVSFHFKGRNIFLSMYNDIDWNQKHKRELHHASSLMASSLRQGAGHASALETKKMLWDPL